LLAYKLKKKQFNDSLDKTILIKEIIFIRLVDDDKFLHNETDPRYRGASIPSRSFRMLQTLTNSAPGKISFIKFLCDCLSFT